MIEYMINMWRFFRHKDVRLSVEPSYKRLLEYVYINDHDGRADTLGMYTYDEITIPFTLDTYSGDVVFKVGLYWKPDIHKINIHDCESRNVRINIAENIKNLYENKPSIFFNFVDRTRESRCGLL